MIELMVIMIMVSFKCDKLVLVLSGVGPILKNESRIWRENYVAFFQENEMSAGFNIRNLKLGLECFFDLPTQWKSSLCCFHVGVNQEN